MDAKTVQVTIDKAVPRWDIFCAVVDNFGDIGVCWRSHANLLRNTTERAALG